MMEEHLRKNYWLFLVIAGAIILTQGVERMIEGKEEVTAQHSFIVGALFLGFGLWAHFKNSGNFFEKRHWMDMGLGIAGIPYAIWVIRNKSVWSGSALLASMILLIFVCLYKGYRGWGDDDGGDNPPEGDDPKPPSKAKSFDWFVRGGKGPKNPVGGPSVN